MNISCGDEIKLLTIQLNEIKNKHREDLVILTRIQDKKIYELQSEHRKEIEILQEQLSLTNESYEKDTKYFREYYLTNPVSCKHLKELKEIECAKQKILQIRSEFEININEQKAMYDKDIECLKGEQN